jgi:DNA-binding FrmR family transcriptional regulator
MLARSYRESAMSAKSKPRKNAGDAVPAHALHHSHADVINRLKRADGHLRNILSMLENGRGCLALAQQLHAVEKAVANAKKLLIHDHIDHCLEETVGPVPRERRATIQEFKEITKYL